MATEHVHKGSIVDGESLRCDATPPRIEEGRNLKFLPSRDNESGRHNTQHNCLSLGLTCPCPCPGRLLSGQAERYQDGDQEVKVSIECNSLQAMRSTAFTSMECDQRRNGRPSSPTLSVAVRTLPGPSKKRNWVLSGKRGDALFMAWRG